MIRGIADMLRLRLFRREEAEERPLPPAQEEAKESAPARPSPAKRIAPIIIWDLEEGLCRSSANNSQSSSQSSVQAGGRALDGDGSAELMTESAESNKMLVYPSAVLSRHMFYTARAVHVHGSKQQQVPGSFSYGPLQAGSRFPSAGFHTITATFIPDDIVRYSSVTDSRAVFVHKRRCRLQWSPPYTSLLLGQRLTPDFFCCRTETGEDGGGIRYSHDPHSELELGLNTVSATYTPSAHYQDKWGEGSLTLSLLVEPPEVQLYWVDRVFHAAAVEHASTREEMLRLRQQARVALAVARYEALATAIFEKTVDDFLAHLLAETLSRENFMSEPLKRPAAEAAPVAGVAAAAAEASFAEAAAADDEERSSSAQGPASVSPSAASSSVAELSLGQLLALQPFVVSEKVRVTRPALQPSPSELRLLPYEIVEVEVPKTEGELRLLVRRDSDEGGGGALFVHGMLPGSRVEQQQLLLPGDEIVRVNGCDVQGLSLQEVVRAVEGHPGDAVSMRVYRYTCQRAAWDGDSAVTYDDDSEADSYSKQEEEEGEEGAVHRLAAAQEASWALVVDRVLAAAAAAVDRVFSRRLACSLYDHLFSQLPEESAGHVRERAPTNYDLPQTYPFVVSTELLSSCQRLDSPVAGIFMHSISIGSVLSSGEHTLSTTFVPADQRRHRITRLSRPLTVVRCTPLLQPLRLPQYLYENYRLSAYSFFKVDDSVTGTYEYDPPLGTVLPAGPHTLRCSFAPADTHNYCAVSASREILLCAGRPADIEWDDLGPLVYPAKLSRYHLCARTRGVLRGSYTYDPPLGTVLPAGCHTLRVHFESQSEGFRGNSSEWTVTVLPAAAKLQWPQPFPVIEGDKLSLVQLCCFAPLDPEGAVTYAPPPHTVLSRGAHELTATYTPSAAQRANLLPSSMTVSLLVQSRNKRNPAISWDPVVDGPLSFGDKVTPGMCNALADVKGKYFYLPDPGCTLEAGSQTLQLRFEPDKGTLYNTVLLFRTVEVQPLRPRLVWNKWTKVIPFGAELPDEVFDVRADVPGVMEFDPLPGALLPSGAHAVRCVFTPLSHNYCQEEVFDTVVVARNCPLLQWGVEEVDTGGGAAVFSKVVIVRELSREFPYYLEERLLSAKVAQPFNCPGLFRYSHAPGSYLPPGRHALTVRFYPTGIADLYAAEAELVVTVGRATPYVKWDLRALPDSIVFGQRVPAEFLAARCTELAGGVWRTNVQVGHLPEDVGELLLQATFSPADKDAQTYGPATIARTLVVRPAPVKLEWFDKSALNPTGRPLPESMCYSELQDLQELGRKFYAVISPCNNQRVLTTFSKKSSCSISYAFPQTFGSGLEMSATLAVADEFLARRYVAKMLRRVVTVSQIEPRMLWTVHFRDRSLPYGTCVSAANVLVCSVDQPGTLTYALVLPSKVEVPLDTVRGLFLDLGRHSIQCAFAPEQPFVRPRSLRLQVDVVFCKPEISWQLPREVYSVGHVLGEEDFCASIVQRRRVAPGPPGYAPQHHRPVGAMRVASALRPGDVLEEPATIKLAMQWVPNKESSKYYRAVTAIKKVRVV